MALTNMAPRERLDDDRDAAQSAVRALSAAMVILVLAPPGVLPSTAKGVVVAVVLIILATGLWRARHLVRVGRASFLVFFASVAPLPMLLTYGDFNGLLAVVSLTALSVAVVQCAEIQGERGVRTLVRMLLGVGLFELVVAALQAASGSPATWGYLGDRVSAVIGYNPLISIVGGRALGTMGHPIPLGMLFSSCLVLVVAGRAWLSGGERLVLFAAFALGLGLTGTRSAVIAAAVGLITVMITRAAGSWSHAMRFLAAAAVVTLLAVTDLRESIFFQSLDGSFSVNHRLSSIESVAHLMARPVLEVLFGSGFGSATELYARGILIADGQNAIDNQFVLAMAAGGLLGLGTLTALCLLLLRRAMPSLRPVLLSQMFMLVVFDMSAWQSSWMLLLVVGCVGSAVDREVEGRPSAVTPRGGAAEFARTSRKRRS